MGGLQVRQGAKVQTHGYHDAERIEVRWGNWVDVPSPGWLVGYVLPSDQFVYEFRNEPKPA